MRVGPGFIAGRRGIIGCGISVLLLVLLPFSIIECQQVKTAAKTPAKVPYPREVSRITFTVAGDVIPHQEVVQSATAQNQTAADTQPASAQTAAGPASPGGESKGNAKSPKAPSINHDGWDALFAGVADVFRQADFGFVNLETPVAPVHSHGSKAFQFEAPIALLEALHGSGVKVVSFANNHVFDQGHAGFAETLGHLREEGLLFVGAGDTAEESWKPLILEKNGVKVGWLGMTRWLNGNRNPEKDEEAHVAFLPYAGEALGAPGLDEAGVLERIKAARAQCDFLLVSIHWGIEYSPAPRPEDVELAHSMLEAGADTVIGHHPHVLQPIETYLTQDQRNTVIIYSLGNLLANQSRFYVQGLMPDKAGEPRDSVVVQFSVIRKDYGPAGTRVELGDMGILPVWIENDHLLFKAGKVKIPSIRPAFIDREILPLQTRFDELNQLGASLSADQKKELVQVSNHLQMLEHRRELILARTDDEYIISPPNL